jgi:hypothetical protein
MGGLRACGARPSEGGQLQCRSPTGERPEITRRAISSEGRGLRARGAGPEAGRGITRSRRGKQTPGGHEEATLGLTLCRHHGRAEPAPPRGGTQDKWPSGVRAGDGARSEFCGRMRSARPKGSARRMPRHGFSDIESLAPARGAIFFLDPEGGLGIYLGRAGGL